MALEKVQPGDPFKMSASTFNTMVDAAKDYETRQHSIKRENQFSNRSDHTEIIIRNDSGADRQRFDVLEVSAPIFTPTDNLDEFKARVVAGGVVPVDDRQGRFAILLEPLADGAFGKACLLGSCVARVEMEDESHPFADTVDGRTDALVSGSSGAAQLLWVQPEAQRDSPEMAWVIVRLGPLSQPPGCILAIVTACHREVNGVVWVTCRRQVGLPHTPEPIEDPETDDKDIFALAGVDAPIVQWCAVTLIPATMSGSPEVQYKAIPDFPIDPELSDEPPPEGVTGIINPFDTLWPSDSCEAI